jgi:hypothetical protein
MRTGESSASRKAMSASEINSGTFQENRTLPKSAGCTRTGLRTMLADDSDVTAMASRPSLRV